MGTQLHQPNFHVLLEGRKVGPYDRRTIVGMRIKHALTSEHVLVCSDGSQLTVRELIGQAPPAPFQPNRTGALSGVRATYSASLIDTDGHALAIPHFKGEVEVRVQTEVLRIAGRYRHRFAWKEDRVKIVLKDIVHARIAGSRLDLWVRCGKAPLQRIALELFTPEKAGELIDWLPNARPWPEKTAPLGRAALALPKSPAAMVRTLGVAVFGLSVVIGVVLVMLIYRRV